MSSTDTQSYFSIPFELIKENTELPFDLYVNSSSSNKERFIRIFSKGSSLTNEDFITLKKKFTHLFIPEIQRTEYLSSISEDKNTEEMKDEERVEIIKNTAIKHLDKLFDKRQEISSDFLLETIQGCKETVNTMLDVIQDYSIMEVQNLIGKLSFHDFYTFDHSINVSMYCISLFKAIKHNAERKELLTIGLGGLLHDLGKIKIPTQIINGTGKLTDEEFNLIKKHPTYGLELLMEENYKKLDDIDLEVIKQIIYQHHENYNGTGYPNKLSANKIHVMARITAIADFFDAITTKRSYHDVLEVEEAIHVMSKTCGKKIDPKIFDIFVKNIKILIKSGKAKLTMPDDFDPCMPHSSLPLQKVVEEKKEKEDFGKIEIRTPEKKDNDQDQGKDLKQKIKKAS